MLTLYGCTQGHKEREADIVWFYQGVHAELIAKVQNACRTEGWDSVNYNGRGSFVSAKSSFAC